MGKGKLAGLFTPGSPAEQLLIYGILQQVIGTLLQPVLVQVLDVVYPKLPSVPLSPGQLADLVVRGVIENIDDAANQAKSSGLDADKFHQLVLGTGEPIGPMQGLEAVRRKFMPAGPAQPGVPSLAELVRQSRLRPEWGPVLEQMITMPLPPGEAVAAAVQAQLPDAEARKKAYESGVSDEDFTTLYNVHGRPPGPAEVIELVRRGLIPQSGAGPDVLSLEQAIRESDIKNKWIPAYDQLLTYLPPPRTVTALLHAGAITEAQALDLFKKSGLQPDMAAAYLAHATHLKLAADKLLAKDIVLQLYHDLMIDKAAATAMLHDLKYNDREAAFLIGLTDSSRAIKSTNAAVAKIGNLYVGHKLAKVDAVAGLRALNIPQAQIDQVMLVWSLERDANVRVLSEASIAAAWKYNVMTDDQAMAELQHLGYTPFDAWVYLAVHNKGTGPANKPAFTAPGA